MEQNGLAVFGPVRDLIPPIVWRETMRTKHFLSKCEIADVNPGLGVLPGCDQALPVGTCLRISDFEILPASQAFRLPAWLAGAWVCNPRPKVRLTFAGINRVDDSSIWQPCQARNSSHTEQVRV